MLASLLPTVLAQAETAAPAEGGWASFDLAAAVVAVVALWAATLAAVVRRSLAQSTPERVLGPIEDPDSRAALEPLLAKSDRLATSAAVIETGFALLFAMCVARLFAEGRPVSWTALSKSLVLCVPGLWFLTDAVPRSVALRSGDAVLRRALRAFHALQWPLELLAWALEAVRRGLLRLFGLHDDPESTRQIVAGLREVIEEAEISGRLDEHEKELIGNVMEFRDVDAAALMTPRTRLVAADVDEGLPAAARKLAESGHSRIPVYRDTLDQVVGTISARDVVQVIANGRLEDTPLAAVMHPPVLVPETKRVRELLGDLRRDKAEMAIVLDEYGGTAGLITVGDIIGELVGDIPDEYDEDAPAPVRRLPGGAVELDASLHVSDVNEQFDLDLPEQSDFETLGGFVLAELGRFPARGETFRRGATEFAVVDSSDRRVLKVRVRKLAAAEAR